MEHEPLREVSIGLRKLGHEERQPGTDAAEPTEPFLAGALALTREVSRMITAAVAGVEERLTIYIDKRIEQLNDNRPAAEDRNWPEWMQPATACAYIDDIGSETLRRWVREHQASIRRRRGSAVWFKRADIDALMEQRFPVESSSPP